MSTSAERPGDSLIERARRGSRSALNLLMASCRTWLGRKARAKLPRALNRKQDASDMVQECHMIGAAQFGDFKGNNLVDFRNWMAGILKNLILHQRRFWAQQKRDRKREQPAAPDGGGPLEPVGSTMSILDKLAQQEECERLMVAAGWCRDEDWAVICRHFFEGISHEEIAAEWELSSDAVRKRSSRAVRRVGDATRLQTLMTRYQIPAPQQDVIGIHLFQDADAATIAERLLLPQPLVVRWIAEAKPLIREFVETKA